MTTETIAPPESPAAESQNRVLAILDNFASNNMPGRQHEIQERQLEMQNCVNKILAKVDSEPAAS